ncbi:MAG: nucleoside permease [Planctomycetia bacterium]|nr:nucleoside permease [Planctomycetia bacterium]
MLSARTRLSVMMFLQYFVWGSWGVSAGGYMGNTLGFTPANIGLIYSTTAIGAIFSPLFVGYVADRFFATEKILAALHLLGGVLLIVAAEQEKFPPLMVTMVAYALCYMPTLALTNSISFQNIGDPDKEFPRIRVWGTLGWIVAGLVVGVLLGGTNKVFFTMAGGASIVLALYCLTLPHTPPRGAAGGDVLGLGAVGLFREPSFCVFAFCSFLICIPLSFYYNFANLFLVETDAPTPTALQTLGQISEVFFMAAMPIFILRLGVKNMLIVGMLAWVARYLCFSTLDFSLILVGLVLHGVCYDFFFVASQIYVDKKAPRDLRASAQSLIAFITLGLGMLVGANVSGWIVNKYPDVRVQASAEKPVALPNWADTASADTLWKYLDPKTIRDRLFGEEKARTERGPDFAASNDADKNGTLELAEIPDSWQERPDLADSAKDVTYSGDALRDAFPRIDRDGNGSVTRAEWRAAQAHDWQKIWIWPAMMAGVACLLFWLGFHDRVNGARDRAS